MHYGNANYGRLIMSVILGRWTSCRNARPWPSPTTWADSKALALEPDLAEAHASLGLILLYTYRFPEAEKELRRAIELNPNYSMAHHWYSLALHCLGQPAQALAENNRAVQLDPFSLPVNYLRSNILMALHENDRAVEQVQATIAIFPNSPLPHDLLPGCTGSAAEYPRHWPRSGRRQFWINTRAVHGASKR
jgi:tetratricopeptide (TPR) repeat protein